jgi:hypothetical protein
MRIEIELAYGPDHRECLTPEDMDGNIEAQIRAISKANPADTVVLQDTLSILRGIQKALYKVTR